MVEVGTCRKPSGDDEGMLRIRSSGTSPRELVTTYLPSDHDRELERESSEGKVLSAQRIKKF